MRVGMVEISKGGGGSGKVRMGIALVEIKVGTVPHLLGYLHVPFSFSSQRVQFLVFTST